MDNYDVLEKLGEGTYGVVYKAIHKENGNIYAIKTMKRHVGTNVVGLPPNALREISNLQRVKGSDCVIEIFEVVDTRDHMRNPEIHIVCEYMDTDLKKFMRMHNNGLPSKKIKAFLLQLCKGVAACHSLGVIHRDLKPSNLLLSKGADNLKIADVGIARIFPESDEDCTPGMVTRNYRAPEILLGEKHYHMNVDMWSVGCIFAEMLTGKILFRGNDEGNSEVNAYHQMHAITRKRGMPTEDRWKGVTSLPKWNGYRKWKINQRNTRASSSSSSHLLPSFLPDTDEYDLLLRMLRYDPANRISARGALKHHYLEDADPKHSKKS